MDNENNNPIFPMDDDWLDKLLDSDAPSASPSEDAQDAELEAIFSENWDGHQAGEAPASMPEQEPISRGDVESEDGTQRYVPIEQEPVSPPPAPPKKPSKPKVKKGRPERKKGYGLFGLPHLLVTLVWIAIIVVIGVSLGRTIWVCCADLMAFGKPDQSITVTITENDDIDSISQKLADAGLIEYPNLFKLFATLTGKDKDISVGTFTLNSYYDYNAMINGMAAYAPARKIVTVMIPEGYTCAQIFASLEENGVCTVKELEDYAANGELDDYWFLEGVPRGDKYCLEGYLFPDTYDFYVDDDPERVLEKFLDDFDYRFTDLMKEDFENMQERYASMMAANGYGSDYISAHPLTLHQLVTLASIVEKETSSNAESFDIASVFYNRLTNAAEYPYLDSDATVLYAIGDYYGLTKELTQAQLDYPSPYNTRKSKGLPPGPIANPGIYSLYAVLDPNDTDYHYFVLDPSAGHHVFSKTYKEHQETLERLGY